MFQNLDSVWQTLFEDAWHSFCEGMLPIAALITDCEGNVISRGRNGIYGSDVPNPRLSHAEMNCMMHLDTVKYPSVRDYILYTTMEPCPMCMGSLTMVNLRHVRYAAHDDYCGSAHFAFDDRYMSSKRIDIAFADIGMEPVQLALQTAADFLRLNCINYDKVSRCFGKRCPESLTAAAILYRDGRLRQWMNDRTPAAFIYDAVELLCKEIREKNASMLYTARIEQTFDYQKRMKYIRETDSFREKEYDSLSYLRNVPEPYGWIVESGTPPEKHLDVIVMSEEHFALGDTKDVRIVGVFLRNDGDNKLVAVPVERDVFDLAELTEKEQADLHRLYPKEDPGEGWFGSDAARNIIQDYFGENVGFYSCSKFRNIYLVQHCESIHHKNGMVGAQTDWDMTEEGHRQAECIGRYLLDNEFSQYKREGETRSCPLPGTQIYCSTLKRTRQTADGLLKSLDAPIFYREDIQEVSAGMAHGHTNEWLRANEAPHPEHFSADYRSFPDSDSDRDLWNRIWPFYQEILHSDAQNIIVVSHGTALSFLECMLMGHTDVSCRARFAPHGPAGSVSKFSLNEAGRMTARYLNRRFF